MLDWNGWLSVDLTSGLLNVTGLTWDDQRFTNIKIQN